MGTFLSKLKIHQRKHLEHGLGLLAKIMERFEYSGVYARVRSLLPSTGLKRYFFLTQHSRDEHLPFYATRWCQCHVRQTELAWKGRARILFWSGDEIFVAFQFESN